MKLKEIETGKRYVVQIPPRVDQVVAEQADGGRVVAVVEAVGESYDVETYTASRVRGCGFTRTHESDKADGVRVRWEAQTTRWRFGRRYTDTTQVWAGSGTIVPRSVVREATEADLNLAGLS